MSLRRETHEIPLFLLTTPTLRFLSLIRDNPSYPSGFNWDSILLGPLIGQGTIGTLLGQSPCPVNLFPRKGSGLFRDKDSLKRSSQYATVEPPGFHWPTLFVEWPVASAASSWPAAPASWSGPSRCTACWPPSWPKGIALSSPVSFFSNRISFCSLSFSLGGHRSCRSPRPSSGSDPRSCRAAGTYLQPARCRFEASRS